jgi:hypothetical protein
MPRNTSVGTSHGESNALPLPEATKSLPSTPIELASKLAEEVQELVEVTSALSLPESGKQTLLCAALHLLAEAEHPAEGRDMETYRKRFDEQFRGHAQGLTAESIAAMKGFRKRHD